MGIRVGLDIGITFVGWCVIDSDAETIAGLGVRTFAKAESAKNGQPSARPRRLARSLRRRRRRRRVRMRELRRLLVLRGLISEKGLATVYVVGRDTKTPYQLRADGLDRRLSDEEWLRVLTQLCKRRGFKSRKLSGKTDKNEGLVKGAIANNQALMEEKGYRTAGEMYLCDKRFAESQRNRSDYKGAISRELLLKEVNVLFESQRRLGNPHAAEDFEAQYTAILNWQAPVNEGNALLALVGLCRLDRTNKRIPLACPTFERFRAVDKLHNVRYTVPLSSKHHRLSTEQRTAVFAKIFSKRTAVTYADVRKTCELPERARFVSVRYDHRQPDDLSAEKKEKLPYPKAWHEMHKCVGEVSPGAWNALAAEPDLLDAVATVLTYYKLDESIHRELALLGLDDEVVAALSGCRFSGNAHLSRETLLAILPHMEAGLTYTEACTVVGFRRSEKPEGQRHDKLPAIPADEVRDPVVLRALSQSRKVLNAIIREYGQIEDLHVQFARDVGRSFQDRRAIERRQKENLARTESLCERMQIDFDIINPRPLAITKFKLWREQDGRCAYSGAYIDPKRLLSGEPGVAQVDHILPHSRSFDDSYLNKVLVTNAENEHKHERTPFEYFGSDQQRWHEFEERVHLWPVSQAKKERLLRREFDERAAEKHRERNLVDTRWVARFLKNFVEENLRFAGENTAPVSAVNGGATAYLRKAWGLQKVCTDGDLQHALDAAVLVATTCSMVQTVSSFFSGRYLRARDGAYVDPATGEMTDTKPLLQPWLGFRKQLVAMLKARLDDPLADLGNDTLTPRPILVSRMPRRTVRGEMHKETVRRIEGKDDRGRLRTSKSVPLQRLTAITLNNMVGRERDRELFDLLRTRMDDYGGDAARAFAKPIYKPTREARVAPRVRAIRAYDEPASGGVRVRDGLADNGAMVRVDVFAKDGSFYLVPVYVQHVLHGKLPQAACIGRKAEKDWLFMDDTYTFRFSLYSDDLLRLEKRNGRATQLVFGYYKMMNRSAASITVDGHDSSWTQSGIGVVRGVVAFDKLDGDILGRHVSRVRSEPRRGFSVDHDRK
ncbi:MAG: type II CRISPR RNA-guided endonuclease Cas9 [Thermoleophilia bacterium]